MFLISADYYQIKKTKKKGRGVFARRDIPAGTIIGDYLGLLIKDEEIEALEKKYGDASYAMDYNNNGLSIFPLDMAAKDIHLINHSCSANCDAYFYYGHTLFFSLRRILSGEELTIDYSFDPYDVDDFDRELDHEGNKSWCPCCYCGSDYCRGTMYASEARLKQYSDFYQHETKGQKFKEQCAGEVLAPLTKYPKEIKDNELFNLFANPQAAAISSAEKKLPTVKELRKRLRLTGRIINFSQLGLKVLAIQNGKIIVKR